MKRSERRITKQRPKAPELHIPVSDLHLECDPPGEPANQIPLPPQVITPPEPASTRLVDPAELAAVQRWHYFLIAAIPGILTLLNRNWMFQNHVHFDPWAYFGHFQHFPRFHNLIWNYMGERIAWIAPGYLLTHLFGQMPGIIILHVIVFLSCLFTFHFIVAKLADGRTAALSTLLLGCNSFFVGANSWDYPEALAIFFVLLSLAWAIQAKSRRHPKFLILSGMAWGAVVYTYFAWIAFTAGYIYAVARLVQEESRFGRVVLRVSILTAIGCFVTTCVFWSIYGMMGGNGFFFKNNIDQALSLALIKYNPWIDPDWYRKCTWLVFPILSLCLAPLPWVAKRFLMRGKFDGQHHFLGLYCSCFLVMVVYTLRQNRLLAFDYRTSILLPGLFLVFALLVFRTPETVGRKLFYAIASTAAFLSVAPLGSTFLFHHAPSWSFVIPASVVFLALAATQILDHPTSLRWALSVLLFSSISFALVPPSHESAWHSSNRDYDVSERVSRTMRIIETRLPQGARPIFWTNIGDNRLGPEFLAVECSLWVAEDSMSAFPNADKTLQPGARIFVVTEQRDVIPGASYVLALKKMPTRVVSQDSVNYQDVTYWVTQLEVLPQTIENLRGGFALLPASDLVLHWDSSTNEHGKPMLRSQRLTLPGSGIFQFEVRVHADAGITRIGALASDDRTWLEQSDASVRDGNDWVSWFRLAGEKDKTFELALEASSTASAARLLAEPPSVTILQDGATEHSPIAFEYLSPHHSSVSNLIANGGFEGGLSGWANDQGVLRLATECHRGACAEYAAPAGTWSWVAHWQAAKLKIGDTYEFSAWLRSKGSRSQEVVMGIWDQPAGQWVAKNTITLSPSWTQFRMRFKNSAPGWISMNFLTNPQTPRTFLLDEVSIHEVASPQ